MGKTMVVRLAAAAAGGMLALAGAMPALAQSTTTVDIKGDQVPTTAEGFGEQECDGPFENLADDQDGWHFILTEYSGDLAALAMSFDFEDSSGAAVHIDANPADFVRPGGSSTVHLWLATDAGLTLVAAQASGPADGFGSNSQFNLSHTCPGEDTPGNETPPPSETPSPTETPETPGENGENGGGGEGPGDNGGLPVTGAGVAGMVVLGSAMLAAGGVALLAVRRRRLVPVEDAEPLEG